MLLATAGYLAVTAVRRVMYRSYPAEPVPRMVPELIAAEILADRGGPAISARAGATDGWVPVIGLCQATGLPVSTLFLELERRARSLGGPLAPPGTRSATPPAGRSGASR